jgi:hypothetical protein
MKEYIRVGIWISLNIFSIISRRYTVKKFSEFLVPTGMSLTRSEKVWLVTSRLGDGKQANLFYSVIYYAPAK